MCGFTGIISSREEATIKFNVVNAMNKRIAHRGPDDWGTFLWNKEEDSISIDSHKESKNNLPFLQNSKNQNKAHFALGHRRLSIQDLSELGHQPMSDESGRYWLAFNGEIFNFKEIRSELEKQGVSFFSHSDTEVLLKGFMYFGKEILHKIDGFYAFLIFDRENQEVFGARDCTGVKPFYYLNHEEEWYFGSEVKCFYDLAGANLTFNDSCIQDYLLHGKIEVNENTFYKEVKQIMPGEVLTYSFKTNQISISKFQYKAISQSAGIKEHLLKSIKSRLVSDVPIGFAVSGGLDSTLLTAVSKTFLKEELNLFSSNSKNPEKDESPWQEIVHNKLGGNWYKTQVKTSNLSLEYINYIQDCPVMGANNIAHFQMNKTVQEKGIKVFLNGQGADELFAGYPYYYAHYYMDASKKERKELLNNLENAPLNKAELKRFILKIKLQKMLPSKLLNKLLNKRKPYSGYLNKWMLNNSEYAQKIPKGSLNNVLKTDFYGQRLREMLHWEDRNTMAFGIESRNPFADDRTLANLAFSLPNHEKIHKGWSKYFLRKEFKEYIPLEIAERVDKKGFSMPDIEWSRKWRIEIKSSLNNPQLSKFLDTNKILRDFELLMESNDIHIHHFLFRVMSLSVFLNIDKSKHYELVP